jgi:hypothetical protein
MSWPHRIALIVPASLRGAANRIGRALDPDHGGDKTFSIPLPSAENPTHYGASTAAAPDFVQTVQAILTGQVDLHQAISADYAARWPELTPPTAQECADFLAQAVIRIDEPWGDVLVEMGLWVEDDAGGLA